MKRIISAVAIAGALALTLTGCGPSKCEQAGGRAVVSHYIPITTMMPTGNGNMMPVVNMTPIFECQLPDGTVIN